MTFVQTILSVLSLFIDNVSCIIKTIFALKITTAELKTVLRHHVWCDKNRFLFNSGNF